jgi:hypothetical protein
MEGYAITNKPLYKGDACISFCILPHLQVSELIWVTVDPHTCEPNLAYQSLAQSIVLRVMSLGQRFRLVVRRAIAGERV